MAHKQPRFTGLLLRPIRPDEAPSQGLRAAFALPPNELDIMEHMKNEVLARWAEFDRFFGLGGRPGDVWEHRAKALIARELGIAVDDPDWWGRLARCLASRHVPGFSINRPTRKKAGAPAKWTGDRLAQLFADVEFLKRKSNLSVRGACRVLVTAREYRHRWRKYRGNSTNRGITTLAKAYTRAKNRKDWQFQVLLCGPKVLMRKEHVDRVGAAIRLHALNQT